MDDDDTATRPERGDSVGGHPVLIALAVCCTVPMIGIVVMTSVLGLALGWATAIAVGVVAGGICVAVMAQHHRGATHENHGAPHDRQDT
jgi:hypothetical protein